MSIVVSTRSGKSEVLTDCERKMAVFCAVDAYMDYDVKGRPRPEEPDAITDTQVHAANRAMGARCPLSAWTGLLSEPQVELRAVDVSWDLIGLSEDRWQREARPALKRLYERVLLLPRIGVAPGTKVLHLMRPLLVAVADSLVLGYLGVRESNAVHRALAVADEVRRIGLMQANQEALAKVQSYLGDIDLVRDGGVPSTCRILDALLWMRASGRYDRLWAVMGLAVA